MEMPIEHKGEVVFVEGDRIDIRMTVEGACASCKAAKACGMGDSEDKIVSLLTATAGHYAVGDEVMVSIEKRMGIRAATFAYIYPFFLMLAVLFVMFGLKFSETVAGLSALGSLALYYLVLYFFRHRIEKEIVFKIRPAFPDID